MNPALDSVDLRGAGDEVYNQIGSNACYAHAPVHALEIMLRRAVVKFRYPEDLPEVTSMIYPISFVVLLYLAHRFACHKCNDIESYAY